MEDDWNALLISVITNKTVDKALESVGITRNRATNKNKHNNKYTDEKIREMIKFKEGRTWKEVATKYNITINMAYSAIKQYKKKKWIKVKIWI